MKKTAVLIASSLAACATADPDVVRPELQPLAFLIGYCWVGEFPDATRTDAHCVEPVYDGAHVRDRHAVTGGDNVYRGETLFSWNGEHIAYVYWNSLGGVSRGSAKPDGTRIAFPDESYTGPDGRKIVVSTYWARIDETGYDSLTVERFADGKAKERRVRYVRRDFVVDPVDAL